MKKTMAGIVAAATCCFAFALCACGGNETTEPEKPEKIKDGEAFTLTVGDTKQLDLTQYISVPSGYEYVVSSDKEGVVTVKLEQTAATVTAVSHGNAVVTASAGDVSITFAATVNAVPPTFEKASLSYDLYTAASAEITLAPTSGADTYSYTYALKTADENVTIVGNKLTAAYEQATKKTLTVVATYTDSAVTGGSPRSVEFDVDVNVVDTAPAAPVFAKASIAYDIRTAVAADKEITLAPESGADTYSYTYALKTADENVTIVGNKLTAAYEQATEKTLTVVATYKDGANADARPRTVEFDVDINVTDTRPQVKEARVEKTIDFATATDDIYDKTENTVMLDLAENITNPANVPIAYTAKIVDESGESDDQVFTPEEGSSVVVIPIGDPSELGDMVASGELTVTAVYGDGKELTYTYAIKLKNGVYVENGRFSDGLDGWTMTGNIGSISEESTYWAEQLLMHNDGKYFRGDTNEAGVGTLASSYFIVSGINKISFKLGGGFDEKLYVALENESGEELEVWRNYMFADTGADNPELVGTEKFILNLVTYIADLSEYEGQKVRIVLHDEKTSGFGFLTFDTLVTYYESEGDLPTAESQENRPVFAARPCADKTALKTAVDGAITEQGDYTAESFAAYREKVTAAQAVIDNEYVNYATVKKALADIAEAQEALAVRLPVDRQADKNLVLVVDTNREITIADYVDENGLSSITYTVVSNSSDNVTVSEIASGKFTVTAVALTENAVTVDLNVLYNNESKLMITLNVSVISDPTPTLKQASVSNAVDLYTASDKEKLVIDFASNVQNPASIDLAFTVTKGGTAVEGVAADGKYSFTFDDEYTDQATEETFNVTVSYTLDGTPATLEYAYTLSLTDSTDFHVTNGGFEDGLTGWTLSNDKLGAISTEKNYWVNDSENAEGYAFGMVGKNMFSAYAPNCEESAKGTLTSTAFTVGGSGWITYKFGAAKHPDLVYIEVLDAETNEVLERFGNQAWQERTENIKSGCTLIAYKADLTELMNRRVYLRITDNSSADYGLFFADEFVTYYAQEPTEAGLVTADSYAELKYQIANGGFENKNLDGWTVIKNCSVPTGENGPVININNCVIDRNSMWAERLPFNNDGFFLSGLDTGIPDADTWTVRSSEFILGGSGWISLRMGGKSAAVKVYKTDATLLGEYRATHFHADDSLFPFIGDGDQKVSYGDMRTYFIDLHEYVDQTLYIELSDRELNEGWAGATFDKVLTYYKTAPDTNAYDIVEAPVSKNDGVLVYENVHLAWRVAVKHEENA